MHEEFIKMEQIASDRNRLEDTYEEWLRVEERTLNEIKKPGVSPKKFRITFWFFRDSNIAV